MPSIKEMREVCQQRRPNAKGKMVWAGHWFNRLVTRWFSIYITWVCVKLNISANTVSFFMIIAGVAGFAFCVPRLLWLNIIGAMLVFLVEIFDCVDGEVARWNKTSSVKGFYLDLISHVLCNAPTASLCGLHLYFIYGSDRTDFLIMAFVAYALTQLQLGLKEAFLSVSRQFQHETVLKNQVNQNTAHNFSFRWRITAIAKFSIHGLADEFIIKVASLIAIFLTYADFLWPSIILVFVLIVFGFLNIIGEILSKYYKHIPTDPYFENIVCGDNS